MMFNPDTATDHGSYYLPAFEAAAQSIKVAPVAAPIHSDVEIEVAITELGREPGGGLVVMPDAFMLVHRAPVISAAARNNIGRPSIRVRSLPKTAACFRTDPTW
jgi:putative ABC transport system substrate-binding protein